MGSHVTTCELEPIIITSDIISPVKHTDDTVELTSSLHSIFSHENTFLDKLYKRVDRKCGLQQSDNLRHFLETNHYDTDSLINDIQEEEQSNIFKYVPEIFSKVICTEEPNFWANCCGAGLKCKFLTRLSITMQQYKPRTNHVDFIQQIDISQLLNDFHHLIHFHHNDTQFEYITKRIGICNLSNCQKSVNTNIDFRIRILDKIHCHFQHSYDRGYRLSQKHKQYVQNIISEDKMHCHSQHNDLSLRFSQKSRIIQIISSLKSNHPIDRVKKRYCMPAKVLGADNQIIKRDFTGKYCFGYEFCYHDKNDCDECSNAKQRINVSKKYSSFKTELTQNAIATLSSNQFDSELKKTKIHYESNYCKNTFDKETFHIDCLLSIMIYCNFTELQYQFTKTYRTGYNDKDSNLYLLHNNFYHLGKNLKICVNKFGTDIRNDTVDTFYHGITELLSFPSYINQYQNGIIVKSPLSTSSSFAMAANFTNHGNGTIIQFGDSIDRSYSSPKYFSTQWISDFSHESEYLFIQSDESLVIQNIIDLKIGCEYNVVLAALQMMETIFTSWSCSNSNLIGVIAVKMIEYRLSMNDSNARKMNLFNDYARHIIRNYFENKTFVHLNHSRTIEFPLLHKKLYSTSYNSRYKCEANTQSTNTIFTALLSLFPNVMEISIQQIPKLETKSFDDLIIYLQNSAHTLKIKKINMVIKDVLDKEMYIIIQRELRREYSIFLSVTEDLDCDVEYGNTEGVDTATAYI